jgi:hypothetical protein
MSPRLIREFRDDDEHHDAGQDRYEGVAVQHEPERLAQHDDADGDDDGRQRFPRPAAERPPPMPTRLFSPARSSSSSAHRPECDAAQKILYQRDRENHDRQQNKESFPLRPQASFARPRR